MLRKLFCGSLAALLLVLAGPVVPTVFAQDHSMAPMEMPMSSTTPKEKGAEESPTMSPMPMSSMMMLMPPKEKEPWYKSIEISGLVDIYYSYNFNRPNDLSNQGNIRARLYDVKANQFQVSNVELFIRKPATPAGFRLDIAFGPTASLMHDHENTGCQIIGTICAADENSSEGKYTFQNILQAYISWDAPLGKGLLIDVGKFDSPVMLEMTPSNMNWNYSHSFIYTFAIPMFDVGLRAGYPITDTLAIHGYFVNGWDNDTEYCTTSASCYNLPPNAPDNASKTFGGRIAWNPFPGLMFNAAWMGGVEGTNGGNDWRNLWEANATYIATNQLAFMLDYVFGEEPNHYRPPCAPTPCTSPTPPDFRWSGVAGYARYAVNNWYAISPRLEWFRDDGGLRTGPVHHAIGATKGLYEVTLTNEFKITQDLIVRLEYRRDMLINAINPNGVAAPQNTQNVFEDSDGNYTKGHQDTLLVGVMYTF